jgi:hypothetical protein
MNRIECHLSDLEPPTPLVPVTVKSEKIIHLSKVAEMAEKWWAQIVVEPGPTKLRELGKRSWAWKVPLHSVDYAGVLGPVSARNHRPVGRISTLVGLQKIIFSAIFLLMGPKFHLLQLGFDPLFSILVFLPSLNLSYSGCGGTR